MLRRGQAVAIVLYDPDRDSVVLVEQFRLPALLAGSSPWQIEAAAGLIDSGETPRSRRAPRDPRGNRARADRRAGPDPALSALVRRLRRERLSVLRPGRFDAAAGVHGLPEEHEDIRVVVKTLAEIEACSKPARSKAATP